MSGEGRAAPSPIQLKRVFALWDVTIIGIVIIHPISPIGV